MPTPLDPGARHDRVADLTLRGPSRRLRARVRWPLAAAAASPALVVLLHHEGALLAEADLLAAALSQAAGAVVVSTWPDGAAEATANLEWVADHATELGADPHRLVVAADGRACPIAVGVVRQAHDDGWPQVAHLVLVDPKGDLAPGPPGWLTGLPAATVVVASAGQPFLQRVRDGGATATELVLDGPALASEISVRSLGAAIVGAPSPSSATPAAPGNRP
jgi:hypothetical protein